MQKKTTIPHQLIDAQSISEKKQLWPTSSHSSFIAEENVVWNFPWATWVSYPCHVPS